MAPHFSSPTRPHIKSPWPIIVVKFCTTDAKILANVLNSCLQLLKSFLQMWRSFPLMSQNCLTLMRSCLRTWPSCLAILIQLLTSAKQLHNISMQFHNSSPPKSQNIQVLSTNLTRTEACSKFCRIMWIQGPSCKAAEEIRSLTYHRQHGTRELATNTPRRDGAWCPVGPLRCRATASWRHTQVAVSVKSGCRSRRGGTHGRLAAAEGGSRVARSHLKAGGAHRPPRWGLRPYPRRGLVSGTCRLELAAA
jgi:hypothetical protein